MVLERLEKYGLSLNYSKCTFAKEVEYLGYRINEDGIQPLEDKIEAIKNYKKPINNVCTRIT